MLFNDFSTAFEILDALSNNSRFPLNGTKTCKSNSLAIFGLTTDILPPLTRSSKSFIKKTASLLFVLSYTNLSISLIEDPAKYFSYEPSIA